MAASGPSLPSLLVRQTGNVILPSGTLPVSSELKLPAGAHDLTIEGSGATLLATARFSGKAILSCAGCRNITIRNLTIDGNRTALEKPLPLAPTDVPFSRFYPNNGFLFENTDGLSIEHVDFRNITNFAVLVSNSRHVFLTHLTVRNSGSRNAKGRNNTSGGILLEQGTEDFTVADSGFESIRGNGVWTHSCYGSPRNRRGKIAHNRFSSIGRDAIQIGHATEVQVVGNTGRRIGFDLPEVDVENGGTPVGIDTAGNVDRCVYEENVFEEVDGKCIDLDGFHDGAVRANVCVNRGKPEQYPFGHFGIVFNNSSIEMHSRNIAVERNRLEGMKYGGIFVVGEGHRIIANRMSRLNTAHCHELAARFGCVALAAQPALLESGIYLGSGADKPDPTRHVVVEQNSISGWKMAARCIQAAPGVRLADNTVRANHCRDE